ncbi:MAG: 1,4-dihydroxy-2-naphthoate octaprenyltransferase, partial [Marinilabiliaceae bacterium]|nr:1,4-dihydroxy-2-naphthoate octaprenyltransferase [Marinilabiliaceae bacterium]
MAQVQDWIHSFRLRTLPLALSTIITGSTTAYIKGYFNSNTLIWASITTLFLQILSNVANDYGDAVSGADKKRLGPERMVQSGKITKQEMIGMIITLSFLALFSGIYLIYISIPQFISTTSILFLIIGIGAIVAAINYTMGKNPYGYKGWGDFFVFLFFGIVGTGGTYYLHSKSFEINTILPCIFTGFFSVGVLNLNNIRDFETDKLANKRSLIVLLGKKFGIIYQTCLITLGFLALITFTYITYKSMTHWTFILITPILIWHLIKVISKNNNHI